MKIKYSSSSTKTEQKCARGPKGSPGPQGPRGMPGVPGRPGSCPSNCISSQSNNIQPANQQSSQKVAFSVALSFKSFNELETPVLFDTEITNYGNAFDIDKGVFTAQSSGTVVVQ